jgi:two-component system phosphate regulon response regulator PhoB
MSSNRRQKIALIEDEPDIIDVLHYNLAKEGFSVVAAKNGEEGLELALRENPDLILLDLLLPGVDGIEVCRRLRMDPTTRRIPIIMVTAKGEESDVVLGLGVGADDYITKPFTPKEVTARVKAVLRRAPTKERLGEERELRRDGLRILPQSFEIQVDGEPVHLTATEFRLLHFLAAHPGRVFSREALITRVIGDGAVVTDRNIDVHIRGIRSKLGPYRSLIETVRSVGYRFSRGEERV